MGLVQSSVGGTVIEMWMSPQALEQCLPANESVSGAGCAAGGAEHLEITRIGQVDLRTSQRQERALAILQVAAVG